jgi:hypothetical protein
LLTPRPRKLSGDLKEQVRNLASQGRTLREIGADVGISDETVRRALRKSTLPALAAD